MKDALPPEETEDEETLSLTRPEIEGRMKMMQALKYGHANGKKSDPIPPKVLDERFPPHETRAVREAAARVAKAAGEQPATRRRSYEPGSLLSRVETAAKSLNGSTSPVAVVELLGLPLSRRKQISGCISKLRKSGRLPAAPARPPAAPRDPDLRAPDPEPFRNHDPRADEELLVIQRMLIQLARLPGEADRRRVLEYLMRREDEGGELTPARVLDYIERLLKEGGLAA